MNKLLLSLLFSIAVVSASSQKIYFVYLQTDNGQPFFVKMNEKVYSSAASGYLVLSKLHDSSYSFTLGFPQGKWPEQKFSVEINKKDHGYLVKNFGDKGWGLFDLETMAVQMSVADIMKPDAVAQSGKQSVSVFTDILAKAADDPSLREKPVRPIVKEKKTEIAIQPIEKKEVPTTEIVMQPVEKKTEPTTEIVMQPVEKKTETKAKPKDKQTNEIASKQVLKKENSKDGISQISTAKTNKPKGQLVEKKEKPKEVQTPGINDKVIAKNEEPKILTKEASLTKPVEVTETPEPKKEETGTVVIEASVTKAVEPTEQPVMKKEELKEEVKEQPVLAAEETKTIAAEEYQPSKVIRRSESSTTEGFGLVFIDDYQNGEKDTIRLMIPNPKPVVSPVKEVPKEEKKFLDINTEVPQKEGQGPEVKQAVNETTAIKTGTKNNCVALAEESDFFKLRKKMVAVETNDDMVNEAKKYFKSKCFTTLQVKNLGVLFLTDAGKYQFYDAAYSCVSDVENFSSLQAELKDEYYINRFKAMLK